MRLSLLLLTSLLVAAPALAADRTYAVGPFNRITAVGPHEVRVITGRQQTVHASGDQSAIDGLDIAVQNGELRIATQKTAGRFFHMGNATITVTVPALTAASLIGSGDMRIDHVAGPAFSAVLKGSGDMTVSRSEAERLDLALTGSGDMVLAGRCTAASVAVHGSGDLDAANLRCQNVQVALSGSGDVAIGAAGTANLTLAGSGDIVVTGGARCTKVKRGSGDIRCS